MSKKTILKGLALSATIAAVGISTGCKPITEVRKPTLIEEKKKVIIVDLQETNNLDTDYKYLVSYESSTADTTDPETGITMPVEKIAGNLGVLDYPESYDLDSKDNIVMSRLHLDKNKRYASSSLWISAGKNWKKLSTSKPAMTDPSMSYNNGQVYYVSKREQGKGILKSCYLWSISEKGIGGFVRLGLPKFSIQHPKESGEGKKVTFSAKEKSISDSYIWISETNGAMPTQITKGENPTWLDEDTILFQERDENTGLYAIWSCNIDGSSLTKLISDPIRHCVQPSASHDSRYIAFAKADRTIGSERDIYVYSVNDGISHRQLTTNQSRDDMPVWSQDDSSIYFRSSRGGEWGIWKLNTSFLKDTMKTTSSSMQLK